MMEHLFELAHLLYVEKFPLVFGIKQSGAKIMIK